jgi:zinc/manganese transport system ATP-binding protein
MSLATLRQATVRFGDRTVIDALDLEIVPGEFLAVLGPNGAGKSTLCKVLLGLTPLASGSVTVDAEVGYIPQQTGFDRDLPIRGRDLVQLGLDGHRRGLPVANRAARARVDAALDAVGATAYADAPIGRLSGGEQQRLRVAQALVTEPSLLLCDEPLLSLDLANQQAVSDLIDGQRAQRGTAVVFVTHEINPVASYVTRVLYLVNGRWAIGPASEVLTGDCLSELYGTSIDVLEVRGRIVVIGSDESDHHHDHG